MTSKLNARYVKILPELHLQTCFENEDPSDEVDTPEKVIAWNTRSDIIPVVKPLEWKSLGGMGWIADDPLFERAATTHDREAYDAERAARILSAISTDPAALSARDKSVRDNALEDVLTKLTAIQTTTLPDDSNIHAESAYISGQDQMFAKAVMTIRAMKGGA